jgi:hypothetical protein
MAAPKGNTNSLGKRNALGTKRSRAFKSNASKKMKGKTNALGMKHSKAWKLEHSKKMKGKLPWNYGKHLPLSMKKNLSKALKGHSVLTKTREAISKALKGKPHPNQSGKNHYNWKGGYFRRYDPRLWSYVRAVVIERDHNRCTTCGITNEQSLKTLGRELSVHHIIPVRVRPDLVFEPDNLKTECCRCHPSEESEWK